MWTIGGSLNAETLPKHEKATVLIGDRGRHDIQDWAGSLPTIGVPEVWQFEDDILRISVLENTVYQDSENSLQFPDFDIIRSISQFITLSKTDGLSKTLKAFRAWVRSVM